MVLKKFYAMLLGLCLAGVSLAQDPATGVVINNWDGSVLDQGSPLFMLVGERKYLNYTLEPAGADPESISVATEYTTDDANYGGTIVHHKYAAGYEIYAAREGARWLYIYDSNDSYLGRVRIIATKTPFILYNVQCGNNIVCSLMESGELAFWAHMYGLDRTQGEDCTMYDYDYADPSDEPSPAANPAPWSQYADRIRSVNFNNLDNIGDYAFCNISHLRYVTLPSEIQNIGIKPFLGCTNLSTMEVRATVPPGLNPENTSLMLDNAGTEVPLIIVPMNSLAAYKDDPSWNITGRTIVPDHDDSQPMAWSLSQSDSLQALRLNVETFESDKLVLPDRDDLFSSYPWDALGDKVEDLVINDNISYIGRGVFNRLTGLQTVQFHQWKSLDSMHIEAFPQNIRPWKFALGDPQDGPAIPPTIVGWTPELEALYHFSDSTVLYVPDSTFEYMEHEVSAIDLYRNAPFWGTAFNRITDRKVESETVGESVELRWLPLENAQGYQLTIIEWVTGARKDTTIVIPAAGVKGLIDWLHMGAEIPQYIAARRSPKGDDGQGGMTLTISIKSGSGAVHTSDAEAKVEGMKSGVTYTFSREVIKEKGIDDSLTKTGAFLGPEKAPTGLEEPTSDSSLKGRGEKILRDGQLYIIRDGKVYNAYGVEIRN